jgi:hypothetical protein
VTRIPDELAAAELRDDRGHGFSARELWKLKPALILWVRHFG